MIWKYVAATAVLIVFCGAFLVLNLGLDWIAENYGEVYEWMALGSVICMYGGFIASIFMAFTSWYVGLFLIVSFPALHRTIWRRPQEKAEE